MWEVSVSALVFMDTETTGLRLDDDIWEFAAVRREPDGSESELHLFIEHDQRKCRNLPEAFLADHLRRFPACGHGDVTSQSSAAHQIRNFTQGRAHIVGAVPNFDTERVDLLLRRHSLKPDWHYHLLDVENLTVGWLYGRYGPRDGGPPVEAEGEAVALPWDSDLLSRAVGVEPDDFDRHTAMGDVRWAMAIYDRITQGPGEYSWRGMLAEERGE
jgi:hypothetical protein